MSVSTLILIFVGIAMFYILLSSVKGLGLNGSNNERNTPSDLHIRRPFLTNRERAFYRKLENILEGRFKIMCQVRLVDVVSINPKYKTGSKSIGYFRRISQWHCDFVLIDNDFNVKCVIELDDKSHNRPDRIRRDKYFNLTLKQAGVRLLRFNNIKDLDSQALSL
ncbi:DUF2726 domain-containing protein [Rosenbergiella nectarea]|uniref:DUF2726 domain-containing protein n=1 Tax=Rosenbergiella nectarea TaxID=988801 RepID=UPI001F4F0A70|nr:DUF2726 domain-containing protein [Rosenbergiella nectarea]